MSSKNQLIQSLGWNTLTVILQVLIQFVYTGFMARLIMPENFALMGIVLSLMGFAEIFSQVGIGPALIQRKEINQLHINAAFYTSLILGLAFTLLFVLSAPLIARAYRIDELETVIQVVCSSFTISGLSVVPRSMMMKEMKFRSFFIASMISIVGGNLVVGLLLAHLHYQVWAYVWALFAQNALMALAFWILQPIRIAGPFQWSATKSLMRYGTGSTLFNALNYAATRVDVALIPLSLSRFSSEPFSDQLRNAGIYERSSYVMSMPITIMAKLSDNVLFSGMSRLQDQHQKLVRLISLATHAIASAIIPGCIFVMIFSEELIVTWLGDQYLGAVPIVQVLFLAVIFRSLTRLGDALLRACDAVFRGTWIKAIYLLLMTIGVLICAPFGMIWVAWSIAFTTFIHYGMNLRLCRSLIGITTKQQVEAVFPSLLLGALVALFALLSKGITSLCIGSPALALCIGGGLCFSLLAICVYLYPQLAGKGDQNLFVHLPEKLKKNRIIQQIIAKI